jgi:hypothetical protein
MGDQATMKRGLGLLWMDEGRSIRMLAVVCSREKRMDEDVVCRQKSRTEYQARDAARGQSQ